jgi:hypothetical protein
MINSTFILNLGTINGCYGSYAPFKQRVLLLKKQLKLQYTSLGYVEPNIRLLTDNWRLNYCALLQFRPHCQPGTQL